MSRSSARSSASRNDRQAIAIVGMACRYPDARNPHELWENVLAERRAFRRIPSERLRLEDYRPDADGVDSVDCKEAALLEDWKFDRIGFRVAGRTYRATDQTHWLALDVAARALDDGGLSGGDHLPRATTGVLVGNSLTGEFSRAQIVRLRWPYVRRTVGAALLDEGWSEGRAADFLARLEARYKEPFEPPSEETLAGGLANTIAGRISNHFDLGGGGYTVDGACASSLLAVANGCSALVAGDLDVVLAGGVDLSLDPFELVGFSRTGALSRGEMKVFDRRSQGFLPGEGCGMLVLMRLEDALAQGRRVLATIAGWGISSDGSGGLTRPESSGQLLALTRAYRRAGFGPDTVALFEAHGTGTPVGDAAELTALARLRREADAHSPAAIGSIKALIGHTKAAAGVAGTIKTVQALRHGVLPPTAGCGTPHPILVEGLEGDAAALLRVLRRAEPWPEAEPRRAGVSAMGFGGINAHLVLEEGPTPPVRVRPAGAHRLGPFERVLDRTPQDAELLLLAAADAAGLAAAADELAQRVEGLSRAELGDLAGALAADLAGLTGTNAARPARCAVIARSPREAAERLRRLVERLSDNPTAGRPTLEHSRGLVLGTAKASPRIGLLFPGQGTPARADGGAWTRRFEEAEEIYKLAAAIAPAPPGADETSTALAQPAVATASLSGLSVLDRLGVDAVVAVGHSLGELTALCWSGALSGEELLQIARARGRAMEEQTRAGAMLSLRCTATAVERLFDGAGGVTVAAFNAPDQVVVAGPSEAIDRVAQQARRQNVAASRLPVSRAFHSPSMEPAAPELEHALAEILPPERRDTLPAVAGRTVVSTVTGARLEPSQDLTELLIDQLTRPVRFAEALEAAREKTAGIDLWIEAGPGRTLSGLTERNHATPAISLDAGGIGVFGALSVAGALFCLGAPVAIHRLFQDRFLRPAHHGRRFLANPCERAPESGDVLRTGTMEYLGSGDLMRSDPIGQVEPAQPARPADPLEIVRHVVASRAELPEGSVGDGDRMLSDLHLSSIVVSQLMIDATRRLGAPPPSNLTDFADASVAEIAEVLTGLADRSPTADGPYQAPPEGVDSWVRPFKIELVERPLDHPRDPETLTSNPRGSVRVLAPEGLRGPKRLRKILAAFTAQDGPLEAFVVWLPADPAWPADRPTLERLLEGARAALAERLANFVLVVSCEDPEEESGGARRGVGGAFARCLHLERGAGPVTVVHVPAGHPDAAAWVAEEIGRAEGSHEPGGYAEAVYGSDGRRRVPVMRLLEADEAPQRPKAPAAAPDEGPELPLGPEDVLLVTGGGRGIAAECAMALARSSGATLALIGRSLPEESPELATNLERFSASGIRFRYRVADVTDRSEVAAAVGALSAELGPVTALLHGAGVNHPALIAGLGPERLVETLAPKVDGLSHLLEVLERRTLRLLVAFGSIIARTGMPGEADYALANEAMAVAVERFAAENPSCRCHTIEWSVWAGVGMGERLSSVESLSARGITPISIDRGINALRDLLRRPEAPVSVVIAGRFGEPPTIDLGPAGLPLLRFLERPRFHVPGVELVVDTEISAGSDPYLADHALNGEPLFPAVLGLEAMAQAARALEPARSADEPETQRTDGVPVFEQVELLLPIAVPREEMVTLRVAALRLAPGRFEVAVRTSQTGFQSDHFRARLLMGGRSRTGAGPEPDLQILSRLSPPPPSRGPQGPDRETGGQASSLDLVRSLDPDRDLYGDVLFHTGRFRRLRAYRRLTATECVADITPDEGGPWFARHLPEHMLLGDPAARDASIHAIQACIPHATVLPTGVERLKMGVLDPGAACFVEALERSRAGKTLVYDMVIRDDDGAVLERWHGLSLRIVATHTDRSHWPRALLTPYLERRLHGLLPPSDVSVALAPEDPPAGASDSLSRRRPSDHAAREALGRIDRSRSFETVPRRPDGKPEAPEGIALSISHGSGFALAVATKEGGVGCDVESIAPDGSRPWPELLGATRNQLARGLVQETGDTLEVASTRIWTALECLKKAAYPTDAPLVFERATDDGWVILRSGRASIATGLIRLAEGRATPETHDNQVVAVLWSPPEVTRAAMDSAAG